ncbi:MAG: SDR family oxidoreductase [Alphaproteobacteria bacterium]|nr:SDR family oxidoreductase [Alphaproteobacteria bacterium]
MSGDALAGRRVLVTGASKGLGRVAAEAFAAAGARVLGAGRSADKLNDLLATLDPAGGHAIFAVDLLTQAGVAALAAFGQERFGGFDVILHALGGGYGFRDPLPSWEQFETLHRLNLGAGAELNRLLVPGMAEAGGGRIIHVGSVASTDAIASVGYTTIKAALSGYVRTLGRAMAPRGVVVTGILPGAFYAPENSWRRIEATKPEVVADFVRERLPRGYIAEAAEIVPLMLFLAGPGASMMGGALVPIDAGEAVAHVGP